MSKAVENLKAARARAMEIRPRVGGFPTLAEVLRRAGVRRNEWQLPSAQSLYETELGPVMTMGTPVASDAHDVPTGYTPPGMTGFRSMDRRATVLLPLWAFGGLSLLGSSCNPRGGGTPGSDGS